MKCILASMPFDINYNSIPAGAPLLAGQLERAGINTKIIDFNAELYDLFFTDRYIKECLKNIEKRYKDLINTAAEDEESKKLIRRYELILNNKKNNENLIKSIAALKKSIKSSGLRERGEDFKYLLKIIFAPYSKFTPGKHFSHNYACERIKRFSNDKDNNLFYNFLLEYGGQYNFKHYDFIGLSLLFEDSIYYAFTLGRYIKETAPGVKVILGGSVVTRLWDEFIKFPEIFDLFCDNMTAGAGYVSVIKYADYVSGKINAEDVPGLLHKNSSDEIINNPPCDIDINDTAPPSYKNLDMSKYSKNTYIPLIFSKGCAWNRCAFCTYSYPYTSSYSIFSAEKAADIIENIVKKHKTENFYISDDFLPHSFLTGFADEIIKRKLKIKYRIYLRFDDFYTQEVFEKLAQSGLECIFWGYEAASERVLKLMDKGITAKDRNKILLAAKNAGIENQLGLMFGFPGETEEEMKQTIDFVKNNFGRTFDWFYASPFCLHKNSRIMKNPEKYGVYNISPQSDFSVEYNFESNSLPRERVKELCRLCVQSAADENKKARIQHLFCWLEK